VRISIRRFVTIASLAVALLATILLPGASPASAGSLSTAVVGMFPKTVGEFAYADLKSARKFPWFPQLREQLLPSRFRDFEKFLSSAGVDPNAQVEELAWAGIGDSDSGGEQIVGVALGQFDPSSSEMRFKQQKMPVIEVHGFHLYAFGSGSGAGDILFTFIDSNTAAFGQRPALEKLIEVRSGASESLLTNDKLFPLINEVNGSGLIWAVLDQGYTRLAMQQLVPQASQFPQASTILDRMKAMTIDVDADKGVDTRFQAICNSTDDANLLGAALQAALLYRRYQESQTNPALAGALDNVHVVPSGDHLKIEVPISQDQLLSLISSRAFAVPI
jgi:hypothetical protein